MDRFLKVAGGLLLLGVGLGAVLRVGQLTAFEWLNVGNATHAHSHTLYWGWAGLTLFALFFERVGAVGRATQVVLGAVSVVGVATFGVFLAWGYGRPGVVLSAATVVPFGAAVGLFVRAARRERGVDLVFFRAAVAFVAVSYAAALSRVVLKVLHVDDPLVAALAVHGFLGAFGAFFMLGVMGLTVRVLGAPSPRLLRVVLAFAALLPLPSLLTVPGVDETFIGGIARLSALLMLVPAAAWAAWAWKATVSRPAALRFVVRSSALAWGASVLVLALVALGVVPSFPVQRHAVVLVVHLQTLGVVTASLFTLLELRRARPRLSLVVAHQAAVAVLLVGLGVAAVAPGRAGLVLAAVGGGCVVAVQVVLVLRCWLARPQSVPGARSSLTSSSWNS